ncbi:alpha/beta hydrolase [Bradyrhizobium sp. WSM3983]|uniref:alpha/beta hydrolase n=1 Tax=Bradyrhizobium sp. WSM3983 TaxID=1038867 RepID=UPI00040BF5DC|nr:alpha/beta hydrolase [Bradyrhizobium sp. WSM3983]
MPKGPVIWGEYDQAGLDRAYDQMAWAPNFKQLHARRLALAAAARDRLGTPLRASYGPGPIEGIDIHRSKATTAPVIVFVHGGGWMNGSATDYAHYAEVATQAGAHYAIPDFASVADTGGDLTVLVRQVQAAIAWLYHHAGDFGGDRERFYLCGHSSGAHLASSALVAGWDDFPGISAEIVKGSVLCSGMYDLAPVRHTNRSRQVDFSDAVIDGLSAVRHVDHLSSPVTLLYGTAESPEFQRQSQHFAELIRMAGKSVSLRAAPHYNHFEMTDSFAHPYEAAGRALLEMVGLAPGGAL